VIQKSDGKFNFKYIGEGIAGAARIAAALLTPFLRPRRTKWGATNAEVQRFLPGDDLVPQPKWGFTHAITVRASAADVWPWLVQMGQGRGGFYSYDWLENLVGCKIHSADRIIPELQQMEVGDSIRLHPKTLGLPVAIIEPGRALVLQIRVDTQTGNTFELTDTIPDKFINLSWGFFLDELNEGTTRLIIRSHYDYNTILGNKLVYGPLIVEPVSFVMSRKMLLGIKQRAEALTSTKQGG
jgi:hypothetical protein